jgi:hypothetical protein
MEGVEKSGYNLSLTQKGVAINDLSAENSVCKLI